MTLAIETSCDDTCVAVLEQHPTTGAARLHFNAKVTSDNRAYGGVHPSTAVASHTAHLAGLVRDALPHLPRGGAPPDFVTVTRGPGMLANLATGLATAKGLAVAWGVPLLAVNHMQAHALTPRLVSALELGRRDWPEAGAGAGEGGVSDPSSPEGRDAAGVPDDGHRPAFPFLSLLVSGGHTMLVLSRSLCSHKILVPDAGNLAIGDMLDKCAREILPPEVLAAVPDTMYGAALESFAFPDAPPHPTNKPNQDDSDSASAYDYDYTPPLHRRDEILPLPTLHGPTLTPPLSTTRALVYNLTGFGTQVTRAASTLPPPTSASSYLPARRALARATMRLAFEHLASRLLLCLSPRGASLPPGLRDEVSAARDLVVSGGVASNRFLMRVLRSSLDARGHGGLRVTAPPPALCTDNAAMIAWAGVEMWAAGWESELSVLAVRKWSLDPETEGGGILGADGWVRRGGTGV